MLCTLSLGCFRKSPTADILGIHFIGTIVPINFIRLYFLRFCFDKFENNETRMCTTFSECQTYMNLTLGGSRETTKKAVNNGYNSSFITFSNKKSCF